MTNALDTTCLFVASIVRAKGSIIQPCIAAFGASKHNCLHHLIGHEAEKERVGPIEIIDRGRCN